MKGWTVIICILLVTLKGYSQTPEVDSLLQELKKYTKPDSARAQLLMDIAIKLRRVNPKESKKYYEESMKKLSVGSGNLVRRVEELKKLGARANKTIDSALLKKSEDQADLFD